MRYRNHGDKVTAITITRLGGTHDANVFLR